MTNDKSESASRNTATDRSSAHLLTPEPFSGRFFDRDQATSKMRATFIRIVFAGSLMLSVFIFLFFPIYWGALWKAPSHIHNLKGVVVDFDGGEIGQAVTQFFGNISSPYVPTFIILPASHFPNGPSDLRNAVLQESYWFAISVNPGSTSKLMTAAANIDGSYNSTSAVTAFGVEARNENAYRSFIKPNIDLPMAKLSQIFAAKFASTLSTNPNITQLLSTAPNVVTLPLSYTVDNIRPFDIPVATAVDFVGLIYLIILSFMITMTGYNARLLSGMDQHLSYKSLIAVRLLVPALVYFVVSCFYSLLSLAFQVPFNRSFGSSGFVIYWMLSWIGMAALGYTLEAMITILTANFVSFFLLLWVISNVAIALLPIEVLPGIFRYGYAFPFYNISASIRTVLFDTKNDVGRQFGILFAWVALSCITIPLFQWFVRRQQINEWKKKRQSQGIEEI